MLYIQLTSIIACLSLAFGLKMKLERKELPTMSLFHNLHPAL